MVNLGRPGLIVVNQAPLGREGQMRAETLSLLRDLGLPMSVAGAQGPRRLPGRGRLRHDGRRVRARAVPAAEEVDELWRTVESRLWACDKVVELNTAQRIHEQMPLFRRAG